MIPEPEAHIEDWRTFLASKSTDEMISFLSEVFHQQDFPQRPANPIVKAENEVGA